METSSRRTLSCGPISSTSSGPRHLHPSHTGVCCVRQSVKMKCMVFVGVRGADVLLTPVCHTLEARVQGPGPSRVGRGVGNWGWGSLTSRWRNQTDCSLIWLLRRRAPRTPTAFSKCYFITSLPKAPDPLRTTQDPLGMAPSP